MRTVYLGTSSFAATVLRRLADSPHRPQLVVTPPDRPRGRGRRTQPPPVAEAARELEIELLQTANVNDEEPLARIRDGASRGGRRLRLRPADPRAAALRAADPQRPSLAAAALARRGADRAGDHGRRRAHRGQHHAADRGARLGAGRPARGGRDRRPGGLRGASRRGWPSSAASCWSRPSTCRPQGRLELEEQDDGAATYAEKIDGRRAPARPVAAGRRARPRRPRAHAPRRRLPARPARRSGSASGGRRRSRSASRPVSCAPRTVPCCSAAAEGALRLELVQPPGAGRCRPTTTCAATRCRRHDG